MKYPKAFNKLASNKSHSIKILNVLFMAFDPLGMIAKPIYDEKCFGDPQLTTRLPMKKNLITLNDAQ